MTPPRSLGPLLLKLGDWCFSIGARVTRLGDFFFAVGLQLSNADPPRLELSSAELDAISAGPHPAYLPPLPPMPSGPHDLELYWTDDARTRVMSVFYGYLADVKGAEVSGAVAPGEAERCRRVVRVLRRRMVEMMGVRAPELLP